MYKWLYKIEIWILKIIPFIIATMCFVSTILNTIGVYVPILSEMFFVSYIPLLFLYVSSYTFKFCEYHRIPLHYLLTTNVINTVDSYFTIPITDYNFILMHSLLFGFASILCGILKLKKNEKHKYES